MTEPPSAKKDDAAERDKTAILSRPESVDAGARESSAAADDRTTVMADDAAGGAEEGTVLAPPAPGRARLVLREADGGEREIVLTKPEVTIGRSNDCDVVLPAPTVSRVHARLVQQAAGCLLVPTGTRHNTFVNDEFVSQPRLLHDGDRIQVANEHLVFRFVDGSELRGESPTRRSPMLLAFAAALAAVALVFFVWRQSHPSPGIPVAAPGPVVDDEQERLARERRAGEEAERRAAEEARLAEEARRAQERRADKERQEAEARLAEEHVRKYLYEGDIAFLEMRYTTPPDGSAVFAYREVLRVDPQNERALAQTAKIVDQYLTWAEQAAARVRLSQARKYYDKARYVRDQIPAAAAGEDVTRRFDALQGLFEP